MYRSRYSRTVVPVLGAFVISLLLLHACRDSNRPTEPSAPRSVPAAAQASTTVIPPTGNTYLNIDAINHAAETQLHLYTWPRDTIANAILMKFDLASIPAGSTVRSATLNLYLVGSDASPDPTYTVTVHQIVNKNPDLTRATGSTYDGVNGWTPNGCCRNHIPLAQADISLPVDTKTIDKTPGFKQWDVTALVQGWFSNPATNFGLLVNSDPARLADRYRFFGSSRDPVTSHRPYLTVVTETAAPGPPGTVADLAVAARAERSLTLGFTEVDDGTGHAATYNVRYATPPIDWAAATVVTQGTCSTPVAGTTIGARRSCTVAGLSPGTTYDFQLVAYRGTPNQGAVYGGLSNVATGTTTSGAPPPEAVLGQWSAVYPAPIWEIHLHLLYNGKVLSWGGVDDDPQVWDPTTGSFTALPAPSRLFCAGHDFLPDGRLLVTGGHLDFDHGLPNTNIFDPASESWVVAPVMARGRWYPTNTTLPNGEVLTIGGRDEGGAVVTVPEVWGGTGWRQLTTASLSLPYYPRMFVAPDGRVFVAGEQQQSRYLSVSGTGSWTNGPLRRFGTRDYGSAVMYAPGKILYVGGGDPPTSTAEIIDLNVPSPTWTYTGSMAFARRQMNATLLPTGDVLVTGGTGGSGFNNPIGAVHAAELWSPATGTWTTLASGAVTRIYHSTTLLLPDGRVLHSGQDTHGYELYSPPYLFQGARPSITGAPGSVAYGQTVFVATPDGAAITKVTFIRLGSVTHAYDMGARLVPLSFGQATGGLSVALPASRAAAPPGPYMLFLVNGNGVPSIGRIMLLH
jgi:galactose oxidase-like protein/glyoxal oxidase-like protein/fibronectin type III domain protein